MAKLDQEIASQKDIIEEMTDELWEKESVLNKNEEAVGAFQEHR